MYSPYKGFFTNLLEAGVMFALAMYLLELGFEYLHGIWPWLLGFAALVSFAYVYAAIRNHHRNTHF